MDGVQLPQGYSHFEEAVQFLPFTTIPKLTTSSHENSYLQKNMRQRMIVLFTIPHSLQIYNFFCSNLLSIKTKKNMS